MAFFKRIKAGTPEYGEEREIEAAETAASDAIKGINRKLALTKAAIRRKWANLKLRLEVKKASKSRA